VDSFTLAVETSVFDGVLHFYNGRLFNGDSKSFLQSVYEGPRYLLCKKYYSELGIVSTSYADAELKQFDLNYTYLYFDVANRTLKKLKMSLPWLRKEFKGVSNLSAYADDALLYDRREARLKLIFTELNK